MIDFPRVYRLLQAVAVRAGKYSPSDLASLKRAAELGDSSFAESLAAFNQAVQMAEEALSAGHDDDLAEALIHVRVRAMSMSSDYDNLVDSISELFERRSIRTK